MSKITAGIIPIWIEKEQNYDDIKILDYIVEKKLFPPYISNKIQVEVETAILVSPTKETRCLSDWCVEHQGWHVIKYSDVTGSEFLNAVAFVEDDRTNLEVFSRAQQGLIVVTM